VCVAGRQTGDGGRRTGRVVKMRLDYCCEGTRMVKCVSASVYLEDLQLIYLYKLHTMLNIAALYR